MGSRPAGRGGPRPASQANFCPVPASEGHGIDDGGGRVWDAEGDVETGLDWWRVVAMDNACRRVLFVDQEDAEAFARYLLATTAATLVVLERWCDGERMDYHVLLPS